MPASCRTIHREDGGGTKFPRIQSGCPDSNWGPLRPERSALPGCATPRGGPKSSRFRHRWVTFPPLCCPHRQLGKAARMNSVILIGNLTTDVELREVGAEKRLEKFVLAVDRGGKDSETDFFRISVWARQAEVCADYLAKGRKIALEGRLRYSTWEDEGKKRSAVEVVAYRVEFL